MWNGDSFEIAPRPSLTYLQLLYSSPVRDRASLLTSIFVCDPPRPLSEPPVT